MRVVSLVPSWTETLVEAGVTVVGRTRFCIHPSHVSTLTVAAIPTVGGTKNVDWGKIQALKPDLVIVDKEENPRKFAEECPVPFLATHVTDLESLARDLSVLGHTLNNTTLAQWGQEVQEELRQGPIPALEAPPGATGVVGSPSNSKPTAYVIWRDPWMTVQNGTFIGAVMAQVGWPLAMLPSTKLYPEVTLEQLQRFNCLFSSEPYPFHQKSHELQNLGLHGWLVDGESYSWFGVRALRFLQKCRG